MNLNVQPMSSNPGYTRFTMYTINTDDLSSEIHSVFKEMNRLTSLNIVVMCSETCVHEILRQVSSAFVFQSVISYVCFPIRYIVRYVHTMFIC